MKKNKYLLIINNFFIIASNDKIKNGDWYIYKDRFLDGTVKTIDDYNQSYWNIERCNSENEIASLHRAQFGENSKNGIAGCHKIISQYLKGKRQTDTIKNPTNFCLSFSSVPKIKDNVLIEI
jgi:hypothetical protein